MEGGVFIMNEMTKKISSSHLERNAYLYVRQSSLRQVYENTESTKRQYALSERALALGWPADRITVIDTDQGQSGSNTVNRDGFKKLVAEVGMGHAGIVIGLEVSRLARNSADWHRLLEICAITETLILDEDGIYDPNNFNDRLLLGLKGTMSEAELHYLKMRMLGGRLAKAKRGELKTPLPVGFVYNSSGKVILEPDKQIQHVIRLFFETFRKIGSALGAIKYFKNNGLKFPQKIIKGPNKGDVVWGWLMHSRSIQILHNPRYAGTFFYGKMKSNSMPDGSRKYKTMPRESWHSFIINAHEGYISYKEFEENQRILAKNAQAYGVDRRNGPPRQGPALLQGLVICGKCGRRMHTHYRSRNKRITCDYRCEQNNRQHGEPSCQRISGNIIEEAISELLIESFTPLALEIALNVQEELKQRFEDIDRVRKQHIDSMRYEANLARRRYMQVDPDNRLVTDTLEAEWNTKLRSLKEAQEEYKKQQEKDFKIFGEKERKEIFSLATDFPALWNSPNTSYHDKKRMIRYLVEDITLTREANRSILVQVRFKGGATKTLTPLPAPIKATELFKTNSEVIDRIDELLDNHSEEEIASILNREGKKPGRVKMFTTNIVSAIRRNYNLKSHFERVKEKNKLYTIYEAANKLKMSHRSVRTLIKKGVIKAFKFMERNCYLCELDSNNIKAKLKEEYRKGNMQKEFYERAQECINEVQYEL